MTMSLDRTNDIELIKSILSDEEIFDRISEDGMTMDDIKIDPKKECWLAAYANEHLIGVFVLAPTNSRCIEIHVHILKEFRSYAVEATLKVYEFILTTKYLKLIAKIPDIYKDVIGFSEKMGMKKEGVNRKSYLKNNQLLDQIYLGITTEEISSHLVGAQ